MIEVFRNTDALSLRAAELFTQIALASVNDNGHFSVALTGGTSPAKLHQLLTQPPFIEMVPWSKTYVFWGDERWVPLTDDKSNAKMAFETLLNKVPIPRDHIFPMWADEKPEEFASDYEALIRNHFGTDNPAFDLILLGMGDDGHTASLFPHTEVLNENEKLVDAYFLKPQDMYRITFTSPLINNAKNIIFLTYGEKKAHALFEVHKGKRNHEQFPSQLIKPVHGTVKWLVDESANTKLEGSAVN